MTPLTFANIVRYEIGSWPYCSLGLGEGNGFLVGLSLVVICPVH